MKYSILSAVAVLLGLSVAHAGPSGIGCEYMNDGQYVASFLSSGPNVKKGSDAIKIENGQIVESGAIDEQGPNIFHINLKSNGRHLVVSAESSEQKIPVVVDGNSASFQIENLSVSCHYVEYACDANGGCQVRSSK